MNAIPTKSMEQCEEQSVIYSAAKFKSTNKYVCLKEKVAGPF